MSNPEIAALLRRAKALIENPENLLRAGVAQLENGTEVPASNKDAVRFCSLGAIRHASAGVCLAIEAWTIMLKATRAVDGVGEWNDSSTHAEIMAGFDKAIEMAEQRPAGR